MRVAFVVFCLIGIMVAVNAAIPQDQEDVRGAFLTSRPKEKPATQTAPAKANRRRPKPTGPVTGTGSGKNTDSSSNSNGDKTGPVVVNKARIGLGLTLFTRDSNGLAVRTDPTRVFRKGDRVRVLLETNTDGFLYIFNTTNDGPPIMIYPDVNLDDAGNYLHAHVPFEIPSSAGAQEGLRWLVFDEHAGDEKLYFVFSREPLNGVPLEDDLVSFCKASSSSCPLRPAAELWDMVKKEMKQPLQTDHTARYGKAQTSTETVASTRGLGLAKDDPQPSVIMMASSQGSTLVTTLDLVHQ
jgi:hypothetical protein